MQKKCITFAAVNNFYSNEDEDSKEENTTATLCEAAHSRYRSVNECYPPPINFYLLLQRSGGRGCCNCSSVIGTYPCGSPHRPESLYREAFLSQRGHVRLSPWKRKSTYVDRFCSLTSHINLSAVKNRFSLFACKSFLVEQFVFPAYNFAAARREFLLRYATSMLPTYAGSIMSRTVCNYNRNL